MAPSLSIKHRLLLSHLFAMVVLAGAFGAFVYYMAAQQVVERMRAQLANSASVLAQSFDHVSLEAATSDAKARAALVARLQAASHENADVSLVYVTQRNASGALVLGATDDAAARSAMTEDQRDGRLLAHAQLPGSADFNVSMETRPGAVGDALYTLRLSAALAFLVCVLAALVLSRDLASRVQTSITDLAARCRALANGEPLPPRRRHGASEELDSLAREFDAMAGRLRHAAEGRERASAALREANDHLESRVRERTTELEGVTIKLRNEIESRVHVEALLAEAALTDPLTSLLNRRAMMEMLGQAAAQLKSGEPGLSVIIADIDHFKRVNDLHGHPSGDLVLMAVASKLREFCGDQQQHNAARWGGEEFLVLLPSVRLAAACKRAEQLRRQIGELRIGSEGLRVTMSLGVAELIAGEPLIDCLRRCDQALYRAKDAGRDTVVAAQGALFATMS